MRSCDVISPMHCLTSLKIVAELSCRPGTFSVTTCICLLFLKCPTILLTLAFWTGSKFFLHHNQPPSFCQLTQISICEHNFAAAAASTRSRTAAAAPQDIQLLSTSASVLKKKKVFSRKKTSFLKKKFPERFLSGAMKIVRTKKVQMQKFYLKKSQHKSYWSKNRFLKCIYSLGGWVI